MAQFKSKILTVFLVMLFPVLMFAADWPQFRGLNRDGISPETGLLEQWQPDGPKLIWSTEILGSGFSSPSIANGRVFVTGEIDGEETVFAFDLSGKELWKTTYGPMWKGSYPAVRTTPTVDGSNLYVISGMGNIACMDVQSGQIKWQVQAVDRFKGEYDRWGISESALIVDDIVIVTPGGPDASLVGLNKQTGATVWTSKGLSDKASYCSPVLVERGNKKIVVTMLENHFVGVDAKTGKVYWSDAFSEYQDDAKSINPVSPIVHNGMIYTTSGYDDGGAMYELSADGTSVTRKWTDATLDVHIGGAVLIDGIIYGSNWENNRNGNWVALDWQTGTTRYEHKWITKGAIIAADGKLYCYEEKDGNFGLVNAIPEKFDLISSFEITKGSKQHWAHPAISDGRLYVRHGEALMVYDIKAQ
ncbi:PQQ-binding-like beta-propeller repeat protein [candidate division KSB1 bacterium]|nr:PQQ-binding-like beta-propeller repeat protein [candidate division KSB1 bacterium]